VERILLGLSFQRRDRVVGLLEQRLVLFLLLLKVLVGFDERVDDLDDVLLLGELLLIRLIIAL